jgi:hydroxyethylthiazole kinase-like sugar kinase family protein
MIGNIVLLTGATDYLSDGNRVIAVKNGHELLSRATGVSFFPFPMAKRNG